MDGWREEEGGEKGEEGRENEQSGSVYMKLLLPPKCHDH